MKFRILRTNKTNIDSTHIPDFVMHENYPCPKIASHGQITLTMQNGQNTGVVSINHSSSGNPFIKASVEIGSKTYPYYGAFITEETFPVKEPNNSWTDNYSLLFYVYVTTTSIVFGATTNSFMIMDGTQSFTVRYSIMTDIL